MKFQNIFIQYLRWHFFDTSREILKGWHNFLLFNLNYFSIPLLIKTFFLPWHKYCYSYGRGFDLKRYFGTFTFNLISRTLGAILRSVLIIIGTLIEIFIILGGIILISGWLILPLLLIIGLIFGINLLI